MRVSDYDEHEALLNASGQRNWLFFGLVLSLILHLILCAYFYRTRFAPAEAALAPSSQPPTFKVKSVDTQAGLDKASTDQLNPAAKPEPDKTDLQLPDEKKSFDQLLQDVQATTAVPDDTQDVLPDKPKVDPTDATSMLSEIERSTAQTLSKSPNGTREQSILNDSAVSGRPQPALSGTELATSTTIKRPNSFTSQIQGDSAGPNKGRNLGFSDLDSLLAQKGPLGSGTAIRMPDDQLFQYNSAELQGSSIDQLQKLGTLIRRNAKASFSIEGYTDSFGSFEYNLDLSQRRADSVKDYLVNVMGINPGQIQTRGFGASKFLVAPRPVMDPLQEEAEIRRQQPNRRVVIVVHTSGE
ncbi:MAG: OmpA-OmpF porin, family [Verrucomicrobiota bacterium]|jgi:outer membrane protein OmpA-like peptidoglycan-associated protein